MALKDVLTPVTGTCESLMWQKGLCTGGYFKGVETGRLF